MDELVQTDGAERADLPRKRSVRWIFIGKDGIRAGWSAVLFLTLVTLLIGLFYSAFSSFFSSHMDPAVPVDPAVALFQEAAQFVLVLFATAVMSRVENRRISVYGYAGGAKLVRFFSGAFWGFVAISILVGSLWKAHLLAFDGSALGGASAWKYAAAWALVFLCTGLFEESLLRGYLQYTLARGTGFWWSALVLSSLFGFIHKSNPGESPVGLFSAGAVGLVFCLSLWYTGSLWWAIGFHAAWDWGQTYFYGTSDSGMMAKGHLLSEHPTGTLLWSGGATGPEGSVLVLPLLLVVTLLMWFWWGKRSASPFRSVAEILHKS